MAAEPLSIGMLRLNDSIPAILAQETGLFADAGLDVALSVEPSWANLADKLVWGRLRAAIMPAPLAIATHLGLRAKARRLMIPAMVSLGGIEVTCSNAFAARMGGGFDGDALSTGARLRRLIETGVQPRLAVVHVFSNHNLLLRYWLAACGIDPARDIQLSVVPPARCVQALADGEIDGFCAGQPWGAVSAARGEGRALVSGHAIWPWHPEKALAVAQDWADAHPDALERLTGAMLRAGRLCDDPAMRPELAALLAQPRYLDLDPEPVRRALSEARFFNHDANRPRPDHAVWMKAQMARWDYLPADAALNGLFRPDLYLAAAIRLNLMPEQAAGEEVLCDGAIV